MTVERAILHVDMDAFFASIEQLAHPPLRGKPVLVGGNGPRGVVAAASYEARAFGCHSAQPMSLAKRLCPHAVVVPVRGGRYRIVSEKVFAILDSFTPAVQPLSIDEAFLDATGSQRLHGPPQVIATKIKHRIFNELGLTASVGVGPNKFVAKLASDWNKPDGMTVIDAKDIEKTLAPLSIKRMWGVGPVTEQKLNRMGIHTFGDLQRVPASVIESKLGTLGRQIARRASGADDRPVIPDRKAKSISQEQTFAFDLVQAHLVRQVLFGQVAAVSRRLRRNSHRARRVTIKIRYGDFQTITRSDTRSEATHSADQLWQTASSLFDSWARTYFQPVRLIGFWRQSVHDGAEPTSPVYPT